MHIYKCYKDSKNHRANGLIVTSKRAPRTPNSELRVRRVPPSHVRAYK